MFFANADGCYRPLDKYRIDRHSIKEEDLSHLINLIRKNAKETEIDAFLRERKHLLSFASNFFKSGHDANWIISQAEIKPSGFANGSGLIPDYLLASKNSAGTTWWVIELKSPGDSLYKENKDKRIVQTDKLRNAISQIDEYINYCTDNLAYFRDKKGLGLESFTAPYGLIIIGREKELQKDTRKQERKRLYNRRTHDIQIRTYDAFVREIEFLSRASYELSFLPKLYKSLFISKEITPNDRSYIKNLEIPTELQLQGLYRLTDRLTHNILQPIHLICTDRLTQNLFIIAGYNENVELQVTPEGEILLTDYKNQEISSYDLQHYLRNQKRDIEIVQAYLKRRRKCSILMIASLDDPDFEHKIETAIRYQIQ